MPSRILPFARLPPQRHDTKNRSSHIDDITDLQTGEHKRHSAAMDFLHFGSKEKRHSNSGQSTPKNKGSPRIPPAKPARIEIQMESPPCVFYGGPNSTGALFSGQLKLIVTDTQVRLTSISMDLRAHSMTKKPVGKDCPDCINKVTTLKTWNFITEPTTYDHGTHQFPFSYLLPGHLPATTDCALAKIDYALQVKAVTALADAITHEHPLRVQRAVQPSPEKQSLRIFPPTNLTVNVIHTPVIHPIGTFLVQFRMNGVVEKQKTTLTRWRVKKLDWRIDEHSQNVSPACPKHWNKVGGEGKGQQHEEMRNIGSGSIKQGWKTDFDAVGGGQIELEFPASIRPGVNPVCDVDSPTGLVVWHLLIVEIIVSEELVKNSGHGHSVPTGAARVLRTQFKVVVTERGGLSISWDQEQPPMYEDVPHSPPGYMADYADELPTPPDFDLDPFENRQ